MTLVCLYCGKAPPEGSYPLGTPCPNCGKTLILTKEPPDAYALELEELTRWGLTLSGPPGQECLPGLGVVSPHA